MSLHKWDLGEKCLSSRSSTAPDPIPSVGETGNRRPSPASLIRSPRTDSVAKTSLQASMFFKGSTSSQRAEGSLANGRAKTSVGACILPLAFGPVPLRSAANHCLQRSGIQYTALLPCPKTSALLVIPYKSYLVSCPQRHGARDIHHVEPMAVPQSIHKLRAPVRRPLETPSDVDCACCWPPSVGTPLRFRRMGVVRAGGGSEPSSSSISMAAVGSVRGVDWSRCCTCCYTCCRRCTSPV